MSSPQKTRFGSMDDQGNFTVNMCDFVIGTVSADGLAPLCARASADTVMSKFGSCLYTGLTLDGLSHWGIRARRFPLPDNPGQVKLPVGQVDLNRFFLFISYKQIEEFQNPWSRASDDFEKRQALGMNRNGQLCADAILRIFFPQGNVVYYDSYFTESCSQGPYWL